MAFKLTDKTDYSITDFGKPATHLENIIRLDQDKFPIKYSINTPSQKQQLKISIRKTFFIILNEEEAFSLA